MTAWTQNIPLASPAALAPLIADLATLTTAANAALDASGTALDAAKLFLLGTLSPQAAAAQALLTEAQGILDDTFGAGIYRTFVHPWMPGVGRGHERDKLRQAKLAGSSVAFGGRDLLTVSLSFPNAVQAIAQSFDDPGDDGRPTFSSAADVAMVVLIAGAPSPAIFKQTVSAIRLLIDLPELRLVERRIQQAIDYDRNRFTLPAGSRLPDWQHTNVLDVFPGLFPLYASLNGSLAMLKGYARGLTKSINMAVALVAAKRAQLTALKNRLDAAAALFAHGLSNAGLYALHVSGSGGNKMLQQALLQATGAPGHELSLCAGTAWVASPAELAPLAAILGI